MEYRYNLSIELLSDACIGNGSSSGASVDLSVCVDENNIPFIPAKRIKGLFKDAAIEYNENIDKSFDIDSLFGIGIPSGSFEKEKDGKLFFTDAYIDGENKEYISIRSQTAIDQETGTAKDGSLRYLNVVNKGIIFKSNITFIGNNKPNNLEFLPKLIKHMGVNRNRGFGYVKCSLKEDNSISSKSKIDNSNLKDNYYIKIKIHNKQPLLISSRNKDVSLPYIPSSTLFGFFANQYAKEHNISIDDKPDLIFEKLFLNNQIFFTDAFISNDNYDEFVATPSFIMKIKNKDADGNTKYVNMLFDNNDISKKAKLNDTFINKNSINNDKIEILSPKYEFNYHMAKTSKDKEFFQYEALAKNQYFTSNLYADKETLELFTNNCLFNQAYFGKSKNSQYGLCEINYEKVKLHESKRKAKLILFNGYTPYSLFSNDSILDSKIILKYFSSLDNIKNYSINFIPRGGYYFLWNLPKKDDYYITPNSFIELKNEIEIDSLNNHLILLNEIGKKQWIISDNNNFNTIKEGDASKVAAYESFLKLKKNGAFEKLNSTQISNVLFLVKETIPFNGIKEFNKRIADKNIKEKRKNLYDFITEMIKEYDNQKGVDVYVFFKTLLELAKYEKRGD